MIRRRLYNPAHLTGRVAHELKESFVARQDTLAEMLRVIGPRTIPCGSVGASRRRAIHAST